MKIYISGDQRQMNAFADAAAKLREKGCVPVSPSAYLPGVSVPGRVASDIAGLLACDAVYLLPSWEKSSKSRLEYQIAFQMGKKIFHIKERLDDIRMVLLEMTHVEWDDVTAICRDLTCLYVRIIFAYHAYGRCGSMKRVGCVLNRSGKTIAGYLRRYHAYMDDNKPFRFLAGRVECLLDDFAFIGT